MINQYSIQFFAEEKAQCLSTAFGENRKSTDFADMQSNSEGTQESNKDKAGEARKKLYTDREVDELINRKFAQWQIKKSKEISEAKRLARINEREKIKNELEKLNKQLEEYEKREAYAHMSAKARDMLYDENINLPEKLVSVLVSNDIETTSANVKAFSKVFNEAVRKSVKSIISHNEP